MTADLQSKLAKQRTEIARLTQALEAVTAESIRRRRILTAAYHNAPGWRAAVEEELNLSAGIRRPAE